MEPEVANLLRAIFKDTDDKKLGSIALESVPRWPNAKPGQDWAGQSRFVPFGYGSPSQLQLKTRLSKLGDFFAQPNNRPLSTFLHEYGHIAHHTVLSPTEQLVVEAAYTNLVAQGKVLKYTAEGLSPDEKAALYYARDSKEFMAQAFAEYVLTEKAPVAELKPVLERLLQTFLDAIKRILNRKEPGVKVLYPLFEKMLKGDYKASVGQWLNKQPQSFKEEIKSLIK